MKNAQKAEKSTFRAFFLRGKAPVAAMTRARLEICRKILNTEKILSRKKKNIFLHGKKLPAAN